MKNSGNCSQSYVYGLILVLTFALVGCGTGSNSSNSTTSLKVASIILAEDSRTITAELKELLHDSDPQIRSLASRAVGRIGTDSAPLLEVDSLLLPNLHDSVVEVSAMAAFAYGLLPKDSALANELIEYAFTAPEKAALNAIIAGGRLADSANTQVIQKMMILLNHPQASYRSHTALALLFCNAKSTINELTQVALTDKAKSVRDTALYTLARLGAWQAKHVYLAYLSDTSAYLQSLALRGLKSVKDTSLAKEIIPFLSDDDANLRSQAIVTLGALRCRQSQEALAKVATNEKDMRLRAQALSALADFPGKRDDRIAEKYLRKPYDLGIQSAAVSYLAGSFSGALAPILDSVLSQGNPQLLTAFFEGLNIDIPERKLYHLSEELLHTPQFRAPGPAYYSAYALYDEIGLKPNDWMNARTLWGVITSDTDFVIKTAMLEYAGRRKSPWFFDVALPLARLATKDDSPIQPYEFQDIYRALLTATASYVGESIDNTSEQKKVNVREIFESCLAATDYVVSKDAAAKLKQYFHKDVTEKIHKPQPEYDASTLSQLLADARENRKHIAIILGSDRITIELDYDAAPLTCLNILRFIDNGIYADLVFHRVIPNFVAQGGDPRGDGWGGPGYSMRCEYSQLPYTRGAVGIATSGKDTGGSQFFITLSPQPHLDARYTVFGKVIKGMDNVDAIKQGDQGVMLQENESL